MRQQCSPNSYKAEIGGNERSLKATAMSVLLNSCLDQVKKNGGRRSPVEEASIH